MATSAAAARVFGCRRNAASRRKAASIKGINARPRPVPLVRIDTVAVRANRQHERQLRSLQKTLQHTVAAATVNAPSVSAITSSGMARKTGESRTAKPAVSPATAPYDRDVTVAVTAAVAPAMAAWRPSALDARCPKKQNDDGLKKLEKRRPVANGDFRKMRVVIDEEGNGS